MVSLVFTFSDPRVNSVCGHLMPLLLAIVRPFTGVPPPFDLKLFGEALSSASSYEPPRATNTSTCEPHTSVLKYAFLHIFY